MASTPGVSATPGSAVPPVEKLETLGRLTAGVTHDFANLMTVISGYAETLVRRIHPSDPIRAELNEIRRAAAMGSRLTDQLLNYIREQPAQLSPLDLREAVRDVIAMLSPVIGEEILLETALHVVVPPVTADRAQVEQVVLNLVLNARDAQPRGGRIRVETDLRTLDAAEADALGVAPGPYAALRVIDDGIGMDAMTLSLAFEPGFSASASGRHAGLGLPTVLRIARQHGGAVHVVSTPGAGSVFTLLLPC